MIAVFRSARKSLAMLFILSSSLLIAACQPVALSGEGPSINTSRPVPVALLVPRESANQADAVLAQSLENAARLAISDLEGVEIDLRIYATAGQPDRAAEVARQAVNDGAKIILGPVFAGTANAAGVAVANRNVNVLAFSNNLEIAGGNVFVLGNTFDNTANRKAHIETTAKELWEQLEGRIDGFTCAAGTGGTIAGVGMGLKEFDENVTIALTDPHGAALYNYFAHGELKAEGSSVAEGIGQGRITGNLEGAPIDTQFRVSDEEGLFWVERLLREEGLSLGLSSGINVAGAVALGKQLVAEGRDKPRVATILCDTGFRYLSTLYNPEWLKAKGLPVFDWLQSGD